MYHFFKQSKIKRLNYTIKEDKKILKNEYKIANVFNTFFIEIVPSLGIKVDEKYLLKLLQALTLNLMKNIY